MKVGVTKHTVTKNELESYYNYLIKQQEKIIEKRKAEKPSKYITQDRINKDIRRREKRIKKLKSDIINYKK